MLTITLLAAAGLLLAQGNAQRGARLAATECGSSCHATQPSQDRGMGPDLHGLFKREKLRNGKPVTEDNVRLQIDKGGNGMPAFGDLLSAKDRADILAYLRTL